MPPPPDDAWRTSWEAMTARAWWHLRHSADVAPPVGRGQPFHGQPRLRVWDDARGFGCETEPTSLTVYEVFDGDRVSPVVREAVWQRAADLSRAHGEVQRTGRPVTFRPTIAVRDAAVPADALAAVLAEATAFRVPVAWDSDTATIDTDSGQQGFEFFSHDQPPASLQVAWSCTAPPEWDPVRRWCDGLWRFLAECLRDREIEARPGER